MRLLLQFVKIISEKTELSEEKVVEIIAMVRKGNIGLKIDDESVEVIEKAKTTEETPNVDSNMMRAITYCIIFCFLYQNILWAQPNYVQSSQIPPQDISPFGLAERDAFDLSDFNIPEQYGKIKELWQSERWQDEKRVILHIQDSHCNYEAQMNIAKILEQIISSVAKSNSNTDKPPIFIAVEGAEGPIDTSLIRSFADNEIKKEIADYLVKEALMTGEEYYSVFAEDQYILWGVEDQGVYFENVEAFKSLQKEKEQIEDKLTRIEQILRNEGKAVFSKEQQEFISNNIAYHNDKLGLSDYATYLSSYVIPSEARNLVQLVELVNLKEKIDFAKVEKERLQLIKELQRKMVKEDLVEVITKGLNYQIGRLSAVEYYGELERLFNGRIVDDTDAERRAKNWKVRGKSNADPKVLFANLLNYFQYVKTESKIDRDELFREISKIEDIIRDTLFKTDREKGLERKYKELTLIKKFIELRVYREDLEYLKEHRLEIIGSFMEYMPIGDFLNVFERFCNLGIRRDDILVENTIKKMEEEGIDKAIIITGGFHTEGITDRFRRDGVSYAVVSPRIVKQGDKERYIELMLTQNTKFEKFLAFKGRRLRLMSRFTKNISSSFMSFMEDIERMYRFRKIWVNIKREGLLSHQIIQKINKEVGQRVDKVSKDVKTILRKITIRKIKVVGEEVIKIFMGDGSEYSISGEDDMVTSGIRMKRPGSLKTLVEGEISKIVEWLNGRYPDYGSRFEEVFNKALEEFADLKGKDLRIQLVDGNENLLHLKNNTVVVDIDMFDEGRGIFDFRPLLYAELISDEFRHLIWDIEGCEIPQALEEIITDYLKLRLISSYTDDKVAEVLLALILDNDIDVQEFFISVTRVLPKNKLSNIIGILKSRVSVLEEDVSGKISEIEKILKKQPEVVSHNMMIQEAVRYATREGVYGIQVRDYLRVRSSEQIISGVKKWLIKLRETDNDLANEMLEDMKNNFYCDWNYKVQELFESIESDLWTVGRRDLCSWDRFKESAREYYEYMEAESTWFKEKYPDYKDHTIAYFSMEYGIKSLRNYGGGLGILAGDHIRAASDLGVPIVGVGLFYKYGNFKQRITQDGRQMENYEELDYSQLPLEPVLGKDGEELVIPVELPSPDRTVYVKVWQVRVGRNRILYLDTDLPQNIQRWDKDITNKLYRGKGTWEQLAQEYILGVAGVRALRAIGVNPSVYHLNEGHAILVVFEIIKNLIKEKGIGFEEAKREVKKMVGYTNHTIVEAGNEAFPVDFIKKYFKKYCIELGVDLDRDIIGSARRGDVMDLTLFAMQMSDYRNGVSQLHGDILRKIWQDYGFSGDEIDAITNGVHREYWMSPELQKAIEDKNGLKGVSDNELWEAHGKRKSIMIDKLREWKVPDSDKLNPDKFTIVWSRRFAAYKHPKLIFSEPDRLNSLLEKGVQIIFAGKSHPEDMYGKELVKEIVDYTRKYPGQIVFVENYDLEVAPYLVSGADLWLNTPEPPNEACGTSGMKALFNGVPSLSTKDGWCAEGITHGENGWLFDYGNMDEMYNLLMDILSKYMKKDKEDIPSEWIRIMRNCIDSAEENYDMRLVVQKYVEEMYKRLIDNGKGRQRGGDLKTRIVNSIQENGGKITYAEFMKFALYDKDYGYYGAGLVDFSRTKTSGNTFATDAMQPEFAIGLAKQFYIMWEQMGKPVQFDIVEMGGGDGTLCLNILNEIQRSMPVFYNAVKYTIVELSPVLVNRQREKIMPHHKEVNWKMQSATHEIFGKGEITGVFLSNELVDEFIAHRIIYDQDANKLQEIYVGYDSAKDGFYEIAGDVSNDRITEYMQAIYDQTGEGLTPGAEAAVCIEIADWIKNVSEALNKGFVITFDYGYIDWLGFLNGHPPSVWSYNLPGVSPLVLNIDLTHNVNFQSLGWYGRQFGLEQELFADVNNYISRFGGMKRTSGSYVLIQSKGLIESSKVTSGIKRKVSPGQEPVTIAAIDFGASGGQIEGYVEEISLGGKVYKVDISGNLIIFVNDKNAIEKVYSVSKLKELDMWARDRLDKIIIVMGNTELAALRENTLVIDLDVLEADISGELKCSELLELELEEELGYLRRREMAGKLSQDEFQAIDEVYSDIQKIVKFNSYPREKQDEILGYLRTDNDIDDKEFASVLERSRIKVDMDLLMYYFSLAKEYGSKKGVYPENIRKIIEKMELKDLISKIKEIYEWKSYGEDGSAGRYVDYSLIRRRRIYKESDGQFDFISGIPADCFIVPSGKDTAISVKSVAGQIPRILALDTNNDGSYLIGLIGAERQSGKRFVSMIRSYSKEKFTKFLERIIDYVEEQDIVLEEVHYGRLGDIIWVVKEKNPAEIRDMIIDRLDEIERMMYGCVTHQIDTMLNGRGMYFVNLRPMDAYLSEEYVTGEMASWTGPERLDRDSLGPWGFGQMTYISPEVVPFSKAGGLADVAGEYPQAMANLGIETRVITILYKKNREKIIEKYGLKYLGNIGIQIGDEIIIAEALEARKDNVKYYFLANDELMDELYSVKYKDDHVKQSALEVKRAVFLSRGALELMKVLRLPSDIIHSNDWMAGLVPVFTSCDSRYFGDPLFVGARIMHSLHNVGKEYQGRYRYEKDGVDFYRLLNLGPEHCDGIRDPKCPELMNFTRGAIFHCDLVGTVSGTYAEELKQPEFGEGLEEILKSRREGFFGIPNGIDADMLRAHYKDIAPTKSEAKKKLQEKLGLEVNSSVPIISVITRVTQQKGVDLILSIVRQMIDELDAQFVFLGSAAEGDNWGKDVESELSKLNSEFLGKARVVIKFDPELADLIYLGSDMFLMPSRREPCGLTQMMAMVAGTVPIVRATGGLEDTVQQYDVNTCTGNGVKFKDFSAEALYKAVEWAVELYKKEPEHWERLRQNAEKTDVSWRKAAREYLRLYQLMLEIPTVEEKIKTIVADLLSELLGALDMAEEDKKRRLLNSTKESFRFIVEEINRIAEEKRYSFGETDGFIMQGSCGEELRNDLREGRINKIYDIDILNLINQKKSGVSGKVGEALRKEVFKDNGKFAGYRGAIEGALGRFMSHEEFLAILARVKAKDDFALGYGDLENCVYATDLISCLDFLDQCNARSDNKISLLEEYLFHEFLCPALGHETSRRIQRIIFPENYGDVEDEGLLRDALRLFIDLKAWQVENPEQDLVSLEQAVYKIYWVFKERFSANPYLGLYLLYLVLNSDQWGGVYNVVKDILSQRSLVSEETQSEWQVKDFLSYSDLMNNISKRLSDCKLDTQEKGLVASVIKMGLGIPPYVKKEPYSIESRQTGLSRMAGILKRWKERSKGIPKETVVIAVGDIDDVGLLNKIYGKPIVNFIFEDVFKIINKKLKELARDKSLIFRLYAGDEFAIVLESINDTSADILDAMKILEEIREEVVGNRYTVGTIPNLTMLRAFIGEEIKNGVIEIIERHGGRIAGTPYGKYKEHYILFKDKEGVISNVNTEIRGFVRKKGFPLELLLANMENMEGDLVKLSCPDEGVSITMGSSDVLSIHTHKYHEIKDRQMTVHSFIEYILRVVDLLLKLSKHLKDRVECIGKGGNRDWKDIEKIGDKRGEDADITDARRKEIDRRVEEFKKGISDIERYNLNSLTGLFNNSYLRHILDVDSSIFKKPDEMGYLIYVRPRWYSGAEGSKFGDILNGLSSERIRELRGMDRSGKRKVGFKGIKVGFKGINEILGYYAGNTVKKMSAVLGVEVAREMEKMLKLPVNVASVGEDENSPDGFYIWIKGTRYDYESLSKIILDKLREIQNKFNEATGLEVEFNTVVVPSKWVFEPRGRILSALIFSKADTLWQLIGRGVLEEVEDEGGNILVWYTPEEEVKIEDGLAELQEELTGEAREDITYKRFFRKVRIVEELIKNKKLDIQDILDQIDKERENIPAGWREILSQGDSNNEYGYFGSLSEGIGNRKLPGGQSLYNKIVAIIKTLLSGKYNGRTFYQIVSQDITNLREFFEFYRFLGNTDKGRTIAGIPQGTDNMENCVDENVDIEINGRAFIGHSIVKGQGRLVTEGLISNSFIWLDDGQTIVLPKGSIITGCWLDRIKIKFKEENSIVSGEFAPGSEVIVRGDECVVGFKIKGRDGKDKWVVSRQIMSAPFTKPIKDWTNEKGWEELLEKHPELLNQYKGKFNEIKDNAFMDLADVNLDGYSFREIIEQGLICESSYSLAEKIEQELLQAHKPGYFSKPVPVDLFAGGPELIIIFGLIELFRKIQELARRWFKKEQVSLQGETEIEEEEVVVEAVIVDTAEVEDWSSLRHEKIIEKLVNLIKFKSQPEDFVPYSIGDIKNLLGDRKIAKKRHGSILQRLYKEEGVYKIDNQQRIIAVEEEGLENLIKKGLVKVILNNDLQPKGYITDEYYKTNKDSFTQITGMGAPGEEKYFYVSESTTQELVSLGKIIAVHGKGGRKAYFIKERIQELLDEGIVVKGINKQGEEIVISTKAIEEHQEAIVSYASRNLSKMVRDKYGEGACKVFETAYSIASGYYGRKRYKGKIFEQQMMLYAAFKFADSVALFNEMDVNPYMIAAALLFDVPRENRISMNDVSEEVNDLVDKLQGLRDIPYFPPERGEHTRRIENYENLILSMVDNAEPLVLLFLLNLQVLELSSDDIKEELFYRITDVYTPIANDIGLSGLSNELKGSSFSLTHSDKYKDILKEVKGITGMSYEELVEYAEGIRKEVEGKVKERRVEAVVTCRVKNPFSIDYKTLVKKEEYRRPEDILDLIGIKIVTKTIAGCYGCSDIPLSFGSEIKEQHDDRIAKPRKETGYRTLHKSVYHTLPTGKGVPIEFQIRTEAMDNAARYGPLSDSLYKRRLRGQLVDVLKDIPDISRDIGKNLKELKKTRNVNDYVYVRLQEEKGERVVRLKKAKGTGGPTLFDLVCNREVDKLNCFNCAKVNGHKRVLGYTTPLKNADVVRIVKKDTGPITVNKRWEELATTLRAKFLFRVNSEKNPDKFKRDKENGKDQLSKEGVGLGNRDVLKHITTVSAKLGFKNEQELYAAIGMGMVTAHEVNELFRESLSLIERIIKLQEGHALNPWAYVTGGSQRQARKIMYKILKIVGVLRKSDLFAFPAEAGDISEDGFVTEEYAEKVINSNPKLALECFMRNRGGLPEGILLSKGQSKYVKRLQKHIQDEIVFNVADRDTLNGSYMKIFRENVMAYNTKGADNNPNLGRGIPVLIVDNPDDINEITEKIGNVPYVVTKKEIKEAGRDKIGHTKALYSILKQKVGKEDVSYRMNLVITEKNMEFFSDLAENITVFVISSDTTDATVLEYILHAQLIGLSADECVSIISKKTGLGKKQVRDIIARVRKGNIGLKIDDTGIEVMEKEKTTEEWL